MWAIILTVAAVLFTLLILLPLCLAAVGSSQFGNVALIKIEGTLVASGGSSYFSASTISSETIVNFIQEADKNPKVKAILLEINSPGGSAVASEEIASAVKEAKKPVISHIREVGASGAYWVASASDYIIANKMSTTGSIGVISSYLEFSGLMEQYGVDYERLVAGKYKDLGTPFKPLQEDEKKILQTKINKIQDYFIQAVAANRNLPESKVRELATGEFYLGSEALELGLVDQLGNQQTAEEYLKSKYGLSKISYITYQQKAGMLEILQSLFSDFSFRMGQGLGSALTEKENHPFLV